MTDATAPPPSLLTDDEKAALLAEGERKKSVQLAAEAQAKLDAEEAAIAAKKQAAKDRKDAEDRKAHPLKWVGILVEGLLDPVYYANASAQNDRTITVDDVRYEHAREDADGVWLYRHM